jgi:hypothetical protein
MFYLFSNGFLIYYLLNCFLLQSGGFGPPIPFFRRYVVELRPDHHDGDCYWDATLFDCLRRVMFVYTYGIVNNEFNDTPKKTWYADSQSKWVQFWSCPYCLGFWLATLVTTLNIAYERCRFFTAI